MPPFFVVKPKRNENPLKNDFKGLLLIYRYFGMLIPIEI
jgi:hypothetical protein